MRLKVFKHNIQKSHSFLYPETEKLSLCVYNKTSASVCEIWGFHSSEVSSQGLLGCWYKAL